MSIGVALMLTLVTLVSFPHFGRTLAIEREAQLITLAIRDAEARAVATRESIGGGFSSPFGVHFDVHNPRQYIIFSDTNKDGFYNGVMEQLEIVPISREVALEAICYQDKSATPPPGHCNVEELSITFKRPAPLIQVSGQGTGVPGSPPPQLLGEGDFEIKIVTNDMTLHYMIVVWTTGAVSIEKL